MAEQDNTTRSKPATETVCLKSKALLSGVSDDG